MVIQYADWAAILFLLLADGGVFIKPGVLRFCVSDRT